jgi:hypothetical protein
MDDLMRDRQANHYRQTKARPTWRNAGPCGGWGRPMRSLFFVVHDVPAGSIVNGQPAPEGGYLLNSPLTAALHSRRQCTRAFRRLVKRHPDARRMCMQAVIGPGMLDSPVTLEQKGGAS